jgi:flagellar assembly protein FliH
MSDAITPKERLTAWQRWELPAFDVEPPLVVPLVADNLPTAEQIEQIHQQAHEEGYRAGHQAGHAEGCQAGYAAGARQAADEAQRMAEIISALDQDMQRADKQISQDLLNLALGIAKQMLQQALRVKPELLLGVVQSAISELPHFNQHAHLVLHPADAELVRKHMGEQLGHTGWKIFEEAQMERGSCRLETAHSQIDATLPTRWQRVVSSIGQDDTWLEA